MAGGVYCKIDEGGLMATVYYVEHRDKDGTVYRREPASSIHEAVRVLKEIVKDAEEEISVGDEFRIVE